MRCISLVDILLVPEAREIVLNDDLGKFYDLLYDIGFDINEEINIESCLHRLMSSNEVVFAPRVVGLERSDDDWRNSGYMTDETRKRIAGRKDVSLLRELEALSKESNFTGALCESLEAYWGSSGAPSQHILEVEI